jgi:uncharacterized cupredoxin-like copper-binding protein
VSRSIILRPLVALAVGAAVTLVGFAVTASGDDVSDALGPGAVTVPLGIEHSVFSTDRFVVREGTVVTFEVRNGDPINHELIVGDDAVHERHEKGTEAVHPPVPGEVSVGPGETASTFFVFDAPGTFEFACHLPGHLAYGMRGEVVVEAAT